MKSKPIELTDEERQELETFQTNGSNIMRERCLAILHFVEGKTITWIAEAFHRQHLTIRTWIGRYKEGGIDELKSKPYPGRTNMRNLLFKNKVEEYLSTTPRNYGYCEDFWTIVLIITQLEKDTGKKTSYSTIRRLLSDSGYSFKRPKKGLPAIAPTKEEKLDKVKELSKDITGSKDEKGEEIFFLDESHFSTEPYITKGWYKKGENFSPRDKS